MLDKIDRKLLALLQQDCTLSLQALAEAVNLTTTPCWKRLKRLEDDGILIGKVALLDPEKIGLGLTAFQRMVLPLCHGGYRNARSAGVLAHGW